MTTARESLINALEDYLEFIQGNQGIVAVATETSTDATAYWVFLVSLDDVYDRVKMISALKAKNKFEPKTGKSLFDMYAITDDERTNLEKTIHDACLEIYKKVCHLSKDITTPYLYNEGPVIDNYAALTAYEEGDYVYYGTDDTIYLCLADVTGIAPDAPTGTTYWEEQAVTVDTLNKVVIIINDSDNFDDTLISNMDSAIHESIAWLIISDYYKITGLYDEYQICNQEYEKQASALRLLTFHQTTNVNRKLHGL